MFLDVVRVSRSDANDPSEAIDLAQKRIKEEALSCGVTKLTAIIIDQDEDGWMVRIEGTRTHSLLKIDHDKKGQKMTPKEQEEMDGSPAHAKGEYIDVKFQLGPRGEVGINGCCIREVIDVAMERVEGFQNGPYKCRENALAITKLQEAKHWLQHRTEERVKRGVKGFNKR